MKQILRLFRSLDGQQTANGFSAFIAVFAILVLKLESAPTPAGADAARRPLNRPTVVFASVKPETTHQVSSSATELTPEQLAEREMTAKIRLIEKGLEFLAKTPDYTAQFIRQELVKGELLDEQEMDMKVRHAPFSVYLKWNTGEVGREILYVDGKHDGRMVAKGGGWKRRLPAVFLEPTGNMAMAESRHPVTRAGLLELARMMLDVHQKDLELKRIAHCERLADQVFDGRECHVYLTEYKSPQLSEDYRKSVSLIDKEWSIPVYTRNFGWLNNDAPTDPEQYDAASLVEFYSYTNVKFRSNLVALDFDHTNEEYRFK